MAGESWSMQGELVLSCNCTVFCPCVLSLGNHQPTEGYCQTWAAFRIDDGYFGDVDLSGINLGLIMEIPGYMSRGNWTAGLFVDERASIYATKALTKIFTGKGRRHPLICYQYWWVISSVCNTTKLPTKPTGKPVISKFPKLLTAR